MTSTLWLPSDIIDTGASVPSIICEYVTRWVHAVLSDGLLGVEWHLRVLRWFRPVQSIRCLLRHLDHVGVVMSLLHVH